MLVAANRALSGVVLTLCLLNGCSRGCSTAKRGSSGPIEATTVKEVKVGRSSTETLFENDLLISLKYTQPDGEQYKVFATIRSPGHGELNIEDEGLDYGTGFVGKNSYMIYILSADEIQATFLVIQSNDGANWVRTKVNDANDTAVLFGNDLFVRLTGTKCEGVQCKVSAVIWSDGHDELRFDGKGTTFSIRYSGKESYTIRLLAAGCCETPATAGTKWASFLVTRGE